MTKAELSVCREAFFPAGFSVSRSRPPGRRSDTQYQQAQRFCTHGAQSRGLTGASPCNPHLRKETL